MRWVWVVPLTLILDQASKYAVRQSMVRGRSIHVIGDVFQLTYIHNSGAAFGLNLGNPWLHTLVAVVALVALGWLLRTAPREDQLMRLALWLVLGGALGNIIDRLYLQEVVDFLDVGLGEWRWPVFNLADTFVTIGIGLLAWAHSRQQPEPSASANLEEPHSS